MINISSVAKHLQFECPSHAHEPLNMFCLSEQCEKKGLVCSLCEMENHAEHHPMSLKLLLEEISHDINSISNGKSLLRFSAIIDNQYLKTTKLLDNSKKQQIKILRESIEGYFRKVREVFLNPSILTFSRLETERSITAQDLNQLLLKYRQPEKQKGTLQSNFEIGMQELMEEITAKTGELEKGLKADDKIENILPIYVYFDSEPKVNYEFNENSKHSSHTITNKKQIVQKHNYNTNFALIEPPLEGKKKSFKAKTISIKIVRLTSWITIGVCHEKIAKDASFYFNTGSTGHGAYVISNDGYSWHHTTSSLNSYYNNWMFQQNDVVTVVWDPKAKLLKYSKNGDNTNTYEMNYDTLQGDRLCFCVSLSSNDETVEIV